VPGSWADPPDTVHRLPPVAPFRDRIAAPRYSTLPGHLRGDAPTQAGIYRWLGWGKEAGHQGRAAATAPRERGGRLDELDPVGRILRYPRPRVGMEPKAPRGMRSCPADPREPRCGRPRRWPAGDAPCGRTPSVTFPRPPRRRTGVDSHGSPCGVATWQFTVPAARDRPPAARGPRGSTAIRPG